MKHPLSQVEIETLEGNLASSPNITRFFNTPGDWFAQQIACNQKSQPYHCLLHYLSDGTWSRVYARRIDEVLGTVLTLMPRHHFRIRKKLVDAGTDENAAHYWEVHAFVEAWFEVELAALLASHGYLAEVEPGEKAKRGPDLMANICGQDVYIEAKRPYFDADTQALTRKASELEVKLRAAVGSTPVQVYLWLHDPYPAKNKVDQMITDIRHRAEQALLTNLWPEPFEYPGNAGSSMAYVQVYPSPNGKPDIQGLVSSTIGSQEATRELADRYFRGEQFPNDGLHVLVINTYVRGVDTYLASAWKETEQSTTIHCLVLCPQIGGWSGDIVGSSTLHQNAHAPLPDDVFQALQRLFSRGTFTPAG